VRLDERLPYSAILERPPLRWPKGARVAVWVAPNIEHYEYQPRVVGVREPYPRSPHPDVLNYAYRDYGNRVGVWRLFEVLDRHAIRCTVSLSMAVLKMFPDIAQAMEARGWDYMSHGLFNTRYHWGLTPDQERQAIAECQRIHQEITGRRLRGWFCPGGSYSANTPDLLAEAGIDYTADFYHDDQPTEVRVKQGRLVSLPYSMMINDVIISRAQGDAERFARSITDYFDTVYREGAANGRVMCIALHPYWTGAPGRIRYFARALDYIAGHSDVWFATAPEILDWWTAEGGGGPAKGPGGRT
jgi:peptidoglycan/xylan/chitin deacetylase (PgdA/CDA1 family)